MVVEFINPLTGEKSWIQHNTGIPPFSTGYIFARAFCEISPSEIIIGAQNEIYYSSNYGDTWTERSEGFGVGIVNSLIKNNNGILYVGSSGYFKGVHYSSDNGNHWNTTGLDYAIFSTGLTSDSILYAGTLSQGLYKFSYEDSSWVQVYNKGYTPTEVIKLALCKNQNIIASTYWNGIHSTTNKGLSWNRTNYPSDGALFLESINDSILITSGGSGVYISNDTGNSWNKTCNYGITSLYYDSLQRKLYIGTWGIIYQSADFGLNWNQLASFTPNGYINTLFVTRTNHNILAAAYYPIPPPNPTTYYKFFRSLDQGLNWEIIFEGEMIKEIIEDDSNNIYAIGIGKIFVSQDEGENWDSYITPSYFSDFIEIDHSEDIIFIGDDEGLFYSRDMGVSWNAMDHSGLGYLMKRDMIIDQSGLIYLATTDGVYTGLVEKIILSASDYISSNSFSLLQNYPNPFNPSTKISWQSPVGSWQTLKVYDILGNEVATLVNEYRNAGSYEVEFQVFSRQPSVGKWSLFLSTKELEILLKLRRCYF